MKTRFSAIIALLILFLSASCHRDKGMFVLQGTVQDGTDTILVVGLDSRFENMDTIFCHNGQFKWSFRSDTITTLILVLPDGRYHPVFAEKDVQSTITIPAQTGMFTVSGGYCNDSYQSFYATSLNDSTTMQTTARIDSFITKDPFSEVVPYLMYEHLVHKHNADEKTISKLISRMSGNMQDAPYITALKTEFKGDITNNTFINSWTIKDSVGSSFQFTNLGTTSDYILLYVWATWTGQKWRQDRKAMDSIMTKYAERKLLVVDASIDVNAADWKKAIEQDTLNWASYNDNLGWESRIVKTCKITKIPVFILLSGSKRVMYITSSLSDMDKELNNVLPTKIEEPKQEPKKESPNDNKIRLPRK